MLKTKKVTICRPGYQINYRKCFPSTISNNISWSIPANGKSSGAPDSYRNRFALIFLPAGQC